MIAILVLLHQNVGGMCPVSFLGLINMIPIFKKKFQPIRADLAQGLLSLAERSTFPVTLLWLVEKVTHVKWWESVFVYLDILVNGFRKMNCPMRAKNAPIGWKEWHKPSHHQFLSTEAYSDWSGGPRVTSLTVKCPETMYIYIITSPLKN